MFKFKSKLKLESINFPTSAAATDKVDFINKIYTPLEEAIEELKKRRAAGVKIKQPDFVIPEPLKDPHFVLFRQIATPNYETERFLRLAKDAAFPALMWEFYDDKFTSNNEFKYHLGKLAFHLGRGKKNGDKILYQKILDFNTSNGELFKDLKTTNGESFIEIHHRLMEHAYLGVYPYTLYDASKWFEKNGKTAKNYYEWYLRLFIKDSILFENFLLTDHKELSFINEVFLPAFQNVCKTEGIKPLIVPLEPIDIESDKYWMCLSPKSLEFIQQKGFSPK